MPQNFTSASDLEKLCKKGAIDLHIHSTESDGSDTVEEVLDHVIANKLTHFALTDHDTMSGIPKMQALLKKLNLASGANLPIFIPGVELSVAMADNQEVHLLAYFPKYHKNTLAAFFEKQQFERMQRNQKMIQKMQALGFAISLAELYPEGNITTTKISGRVHAALWTVKNGYATSVADAFDKYFALGKPAYVERNKPSLEAAIKEVLSADGIPVLAHPQQYNWCNIQQPGLVPKKLYENLGLAKSYGLQGVEAFHADATFSQQNAISAAAKVLGLIRTAGSDDHGQNKPQRTLYHQNSVFIKKHELFVSSGLISDQKGKWLLGKRDKNRKSSGFYELPGGKIEFNEKPDAALKRELKEELGVDSTIQELAFILYHPFAKTQENAYSQLIMPCYYATLKSQKIYMFAHDDLIYCTPEEALNKNILAADIPIFKALIKK